MNEKRKLRNLLAYTKTDTIEELEDCNKLYEELLAYINKSEKVTELLGLYRKHINNLCKQDREGVKNSMFSSEFIAYELYEQIKQLEKELGK